MASKPLSELIYLQTYHSSRESIQLFTLSRLRKPSDEKNSDTSSSPETVEAAAAKFISLCSMGIEPKELFKNFCLHKICGREVECKDIGAKVLSASLMDVLYPLFTSLTT